MPEVNTDALMEAFDKYDDDQLEDIRELLGEKIQQRNNARKQRNKYLFVGDRVRLIRAGTKLPKGAEGRFVKRARTRCTVEFDTYGRYTVPLDMIVEVT